jgi:transposase
MSKPDYLTQRLLKSPEGAAALRAMEQERDQRVIELYQRGYTTREIAKMRGVGIASNKGVAYILQKHGVARRGRGRTAELVELRAQNRLPKLPGTKPRKDRGVPRGPQKGRSAAAKAQAARMTPEARSERARAGAEGRWARVRTARPAADGDTILDRLVRIEKYLVTALGLAGLIVFPDGTVRPADEDAPRSDLTGETLDEATRRALDEVNQRILAELETNRFDLTLPDTPPAPTNGTGPTSEHPVATTEEAHSWKDEAVADRQYGLRPHERAQLEHPTFWTDGRVQHYFETRQAGETMDEWVRRVLGSLAAKELEAERLANWANKGGTPTGIDTRPTSQP